MSTRTKLELTWIGDALPASKPERPSIVHRSHEGDCAEEIYCGDVGPVAAGRLPDAENRAPTGRC